MIRNNQGILYIATGPKCKEEAIYNMSRSRQFLGSRVSCLVTDVPTDIDYKYFDYVYKHKNPCYGYRDKILPLLNLPFKFTLFLDSDAFLIQPVDNIFDLGIYADFAAVHAPVRHPPGFHSEFVPSSFPEYNSGVMFFKRSKVQKKLVKLWLSYYDFLFDNYAQSWDQASLRIALWEMMLSRKSFRLLSLPSEFNLRTSKPWIAGRGQPVSVIHGRFDASEVNEFIKYLNSDFDRFRTSFGWLNAYPNSSIRAKFDRMNF
ncbi:hypothetical protein [Synechococcus sp. CC9616]|uniref:hypothetical protein n=1 Tax=Synechococcus sp. CC9616 TaxID=110663 RepID=UPI0012EC0A76|nr:hypothetical protein [Synechococcus sp. CC9616]